MPFKTTADLPENVQHVLPEHGQEIYKEAFNSAWEQYKNPDDRYQARSREETAHAVAWDAVKNVYEKNEDGKWVAKKSHKT